MATPAKPGTGAAERLRYPRWIAPFVAPALFLLGHVALPYGLSLLGERYGWARERPGIWNWPALVVVAAGIAGTLWTIGLHARADRNTLLQLLPNRTLLTPGPYAVSRNPMYLFELTFWLGWALFYGSVAVFAGLVLWALMFNFGAVPYEERFLEARFGDAYRAYKARVPRWLGLPRRGSN